MAARREAAAAGAEAARALEEYGIEADVLVAEYGPDVPVAGRRGGRAAGALRPGRAGAAGPGRAGQLDQLGKVNPLALEEFAALEERHEFLAAQLEDLKKTRRDLLTVVKEVDERVQQVFTAAYEDAAREFEDIFCRLFPGGEGRWC